VFLQSCGGLFCSPFSLHATLAHKVVMQAIPHAVPILLSHAQRSCASWREASPSCANKHTLRANTVSSHPTLLPACQLVAGRVAWCLGGCRCCSDARRPSLHPPCHPHSQSPFYHPCRPPGQVMCLVMDIPSESMSI